MPIKTFQVIQNQQQQQVRSVEAPSCYPQDSKDLLPTPWCQTSQDIPKSGVYMDQTFSGLIWIRWIRRTVQQLKLFVKVFGLVGWCVDGQDSGFPSRTVHRNSDHCPFSVDAFQCIRTSVIHFIFIFSIIAIPISLSSTYHSHPFVSCQISLSRSWWQQGRQGSPDDPLPSKVFQLLLGGGSRMRNIFSPDVLDLSQGHLRASCAWKTFRRSYPESIFIRCWNHLTFGLKEQHSSAELTADIWAPQGEPSYLETHFVYRLILSVTRSVWSSVRAGM